MSARILSGREVAASVEEALRGRVRALESGGHTPGLASVLVGEDTPSQIYVSGKHRAAARVGLRSFDHRLPTDAGQGRLEALLDELNADPAVDGIIVQLPLPGSIDEESILERIDPTKDVDGLHPVNLGRLVLGRPGPVPCTPLGIMVLLDHYGVETAGRTATIVGRSLLVGRPVALLLGARGTDATVIQAHSRTPDLEAFTRQADILVTAVGSPGLIGAEHVKPGGTVVDVGITRRGDELRGDVDVAAVSRVVGAITPVPGGVGPMTVAMLLANTVAAAESRLSAAGDG